MATLTGHETLEDVVGAPDFEAKLKEVVAQIDHRTNRCIATSAASHTEAGRRAQEEAVGCEWKFVYPVWQTTRPVRS